MVFIYSKLGYLILSLSNSQRVLMFSQVISRLSLLSSFNKLDNLGVKRYRHKEGVAQRLLSHIFITNVLYIGFQTVNDSRGIYKDFYH